MVNELFGFEPDSRTTGARFLFAFLFLCVASGCEEVGKVVDNVKSEVSGPAPSVAAPEVTPAPADSLPSMEIAKPSSPQELIARFQKLSSTEITDNDLSQLAAAPEAAAAITTIDLSGNTHVSRSGLEQLAALKNLASLKMASCSTLPADLAALGSAASLQQLFLSGTKTDDSVVQRLSSLPELNELDLSGTAITPAAGAMLGRSATLTNINLSSTTSNDATAGHMAALPLVKLDVSKTQITNAGLQEILRIQTLESLNASFTSVTGIGFKGFNQAGLKELNVAATSFGLEGFDAIRGMKSLEILGVYQAGLVEHKAANVFRTMPKLRILNAGQNAVTDAGMEVFFKGLDSLEELHLGHNSLISDRGLASLVGVKTLKYLDVTGTNCSAAGANALKAKLPECKIATDDGTF